MGIAIVRNDVRKEVIANASGLERAGGLEVFEFEEDSTALSQTMFLLIASVKLVCVVGTCHPAARERAADSISGVSIQGFLLCAISLAPLL